MVGEEILSLNPRFLKGSPRMHSYPLLALAAAASLVLSGNGAQRPNAASPSDSTAKSAASKPSPSEIARRQNAEQIEEILQVARQWETLQMAHFQELDRTATSWQEAGFEPPASKGLFSYHDESDALVIRMDKSVGQCPAGAKWSVRIVGTKGWDVEFSRSVSNKKCEAILPQFRAGK